MAARKDVPWPRLIAAAAGICLLVGFLADSLLVIALGPVLGTTAWLLARRQAANAGRPRPGAGGKARPAAGGAKGRPAAGGGKGRPAAAKTRPRR